MVANLPEHLVKQALALSVEQRAALSDLLDASLPAPQVTPEERAEWDRRWAAYEADPSIALDGETVMQEIREMLESHRKRRDAS